MLPNSNSNFRFQGYRGWAIIDGYVHDPGRRVSTAVTIDLQVQLLRGRDAVVHASTPERVRQWQALAEAAAVGVAVYQSPGFVLPWYEVYDAEYEPLLCLGTAADGTLAGLLPLALRRRPPGGLCFAGAEHCEYAGWLATPAAQLEFPARCVARLSEHGHFTEM